MSTEIIDIPQYEYYQETFNMSINDVTNRKRFTQLGTMGWNLISINSEYDGNIYTFKRQYGIKRAEVKVELVEVKT